MQELNAHKSIVSKRKPDPTTFLPHDQEIDVNLKIQDVYEMWGVAEESAGDCWLLLGSYESKKGDEIILEQLMETGHRRNVPFLIPRWMLTASQYMTWHMSIKCPTK